MRAVQMPQIKRRISCNDMFNGCPAIFSAYHVHANRSYLVSEMYDVNETRGSR